ncbi:MAG TPA: thioesterase family protein [Blastocatellia bacterium]|nr:thioesterase family protein [Blastocatellia bacterium]
MKLSERIPLGASATKQVQVTREMTVAHHVDGMPEVYGTPIMIFHMETAAGEAIMPHLPDGCISVGVVVNVKHLAATPVGATVTVKAEVVGVSDATVTFAVEAHDGVEKIGEGTHVRAPVELERFLRKVAGKAEKR